MKKLVVLLLIGTISLGVHAQKKLPKVDIKTLQGKTVSSETIVNNEKPVVISFWATWCKPCLVEMEAISENFEDWIEEKDFQFIAVSTDDSRSSSRVKSLVAGKGWPFEFYLDANQEFKRALNINTVPFLIIINTKGEIIYEHSGYTPGDEYEMFEKVKGL